MKRIIAAFAVVAAAAWPAAVFTGVGVAHADYIYVPLLASTKVSPDSPNTMVLSTPVLVNPGDMLRVTGQLAVSEPGGHNYPEMDFAVTCLDQRGRTIPQPNGKQSFGSGTNYMGDNDAFQWNASMLLVAPNPLPADANGGAPPPQAFFTCGIQVSFDYQTTVLPPTPGQTTHGTWLEVSSYPQTQGAQQWWWFPPPGDDPDICPTADKYVGGVEGGPIATDANAGPSKCVYLGGPNPNSISIFQNTFQNTWSASDDATVVDFAATGQNTVCFQTTGSCREIDDGPGDYSQITSWLAIQQQYPDGFPCGPSTVVYSEDTVKGDAETDTKETLAVSRYQHHSPVYYHATVPVSQLCGGSRKFDMSLYTQVGEGIPIKFENKNLNVINLERAPTTTVPQVTGLTEQQATAAIVAAGLYTGAPDNVTSTAPPGTVLAQNSPGGTVEPVGSQVQITVSYGQTTVPDVLGDLATVAEQAIRSAGLTPVTSTIINCVDQRALGKVQSQNPGGGAQVSPGAQVNIQIIACNR